MIYGITTSGDCEIIKWPNKKTAERSGNQWLLIETEQDLADSSISTGRLAELWNHHNADTPVRKFEEREVGAKQVFAMLERVAITPKKMSTAPGKDKGDEEVAKSATAKKPGKTTAKNAAKAVSSGKGKGNVANLKVRKSKYTGMKLFPSKAAAETNPRKKDSHGFKSIEIIRKSPGITYEDYIKKGGRGNDLEWDVEKGNVTTK